MEPAARLRFPVQAGAGPRAASLVFLPRAEAPPAQDEAGAPPASGGGGRLRGR